jgi:hypothetical protein
MTSVDVSAAVFRFAALAVGVPAVVWLIVKTTVDVWEKTPKFLRIIKTIFTALYRFCRAAFLRIRDLLSFVRATLTRWLGGRKLRITFDSDPPPFPGSPTPYYPRLRGRSRAPPEAAAAICALISTTMTNYIGALT